MKVRMGAEDRGGENKKVEEEEKKSEKEQGKGKAKAQDFRTSELEVLCSEGGQRPQALRAGPSIRDLTCVQLMMAALKGQCHKIFCFSFFS